MAFPELSHKHTQLLRRVTYLMAVICLAYLAETSTRSAGLKNDPPQTNAAISLISLRTSDLLYDPIRNTIYASVPTNASSNADTVVSISPATGQVQSTITSGSNPG